jgi:hypothetical protein
MKDIHAHRATPRAAVGWQFASCPNDTKPSDQPQHMLFKKAITNALLVWSTPNDTATSLIANKQHANMH